MKVVLLGGTSGMGRALGQRLSERGDEVFLLGNEPEQLARSAADLKARHPQQRDVGHAPCDLERPADFAPALDAADAALGGFDTVIVTAGMFATQDALEADVELARRLVTVNYAHTVAFCEHARKRLLARGGGSLVVFSSVAGDVTWVHAPRPESVPVYTAISPSSDQSSCGTVNETAATPSSATS